MKKLNMLLLFFVLLVPQLLGGADGPLIVDKKISTAGEKKPFLFESGDAKLTLGGKSTTEYRLAKNAVMLNSNLPDEASHARQTVDTKLLFSYGEQKYGHKAIEANATARFKTIWGKVGEMSGTESEEVKIGGVVNGVHKHVGAKPYWWFKEAWLKFTFNSVFNCESEKLHAMKLGMFSFALGRGIALGDAYGVSKDFLAIYSRSTDYYAPGLLLTGEVVKDKLWYDVYYAKLEDKSASFGDTFKSVKEKIVGRSATPWRGVAKDSDLIAARLKFKYESDNKSLGTLNLEPYVYYNEASDQKVTLPADSKSTLGAVGIGSEYTNKNFEFGGEVAVNYGHEDLYHIDTNKVELAMSEYVGETIGTLKQVYSKVLYNQTTAGYTAGDKVPTCDANVKKAIAANTNYNNKGIFTSNTTYKSDVDRFRNAYRNDYRGWMAVFDAAYLFDSCDIKVAAAYGYASGDRNPHYREGATDTDVGCYKNKKYKGFVSLHELYSGKRVPSVFILDARSIKRPLTLVTSTGEADSDPSFADLQYVGAGMTWAPKKWKEHNFSINPNLLFFWKAHESLKWDATKNEGAGGVSDCEKARLFLGTEFNIKARYDLLKDLALKGDFALFVPNSYYKDIKGASMKGDLFNKLEKADKQNLTSSTYRLGSDNALYCKIALEYSF